MKRTAAFLLLPFLACTTARMNTEAIDQPLMDRARKLAKSTLITDGHIDLPYRLQVKNFRLERKYLGIPVETNDGDFDYKRAKAGGLDAPFMSIFIPSSEQKDLAGAKILADSLIDMVQGIIAAHPDKFAHGNSPEEIERNFARGLISLPMGLENGAPIEHLNDLAHFYGRGIRYVTLTHGKDNHICDSSYDTTATWGGLSPYGRELIVAMNETGMMIDVSHISDKTFYQVMELSKSPVIASHSSCRAFTPGWERNMDDDMIRLLGKKDGVIQINFGGAFLDPEIEAARKKFNRELDERLAKAGLDRNDPKAKTIEEKLRKEFPTIYSDVKRVADHIDHVRQIAGIEHVGLGSDFDGVGDSLPTGLKDVSMYPNLIYELLRRGYSDADMEKICYQNVWRVWRKVNSIASQK